MKTIKINDYNELESIKEIEEKEFIVDLLETMVEQKRRIIDFLCGLTFLNGTFEKIEKDIYKIVTSKE